MVVVQGLVWDDRNKEHLYRHGITIEEVEEVCHREHQRRWNYEQKKNNYAQDVSF